MRRVVPVTNFLNDVSGNCEPIVTDKLDLTGSEHLWSIKGVCALMASAVCVGIGDFPITRLVSYTFVVKGSSWNWLLGPELYWCVIQTGSGLMRLYSWSKGLKGNLVWVITTSVFPHSHDCGQCVVSSSVYKPVHLRIKSVQFLLIIGLVTPWLDSLQTCLVVTPAPHLSSMKTQL